MPALSKYNSEYHDDWAWSLAIKGATNEEIAEAFGISTRTFIRWEKEHESLRDAVLRGKCAADAKVEKSLFQRAIGFTVEDTERTVDIDKDGNPKPVRVRTTKKNVPPDTMAIMYWLNNRKRNQWSQRQETTITAEDSEGQVVSIADAIIEAGRRRREKDNDDSNG